MSDLEQTLRRSVPQAIAQVLMDRITQGDIRPGEALKESDLVEEFNASRNTVRESLIRLEHMGVVERLAHRGSRVALPGRGEIQQVMAMRRVVEPGAVRVLVSGGVLDFGVLSRIADRMESAAADGDWVAYGALDLDFHATLVDMAGGPVLTQVFEAALRRLRLAFLVSDRQSDDADAEPHVWEHNELVARIKAGNMDEALTLIETHLANAESVLFLGAAEPE